MNLVHNERTKLTATLFNAFAAALIATGLIAPVAAVAYGISELRIGAAYTAALLLVCGSGGAVLHWIGRAVLGSLRE